LLSSFVVFSLIFISFFNHFVQSFFIS
jgi:hypothetical protein